MFDEDAVIAQGLLDVGNPRLGAHQWRALLGGLAGLPDLFNELLSDDFHALADGLLQGCQTCPASLLGTLQGACCRRRHQADVLSDLLVECFFEEGHPLFHLFQIVGVVSAHTTVGPCDHLQLLDSLLVVPHSGIHVHHAGIQGVNALHGVIRGAWADRCNRGATPRLPRRRLRLLSQTARGPRPPILLARVDHAPVRDDGRGLVVRRWSFLATAWHAAPRVQRADRHQRPGGIVVGTFLPEGLDGILLHWASGTADDKPLRHGRIRRCAKLCSARGWGSCGSVRALALEPKDA
mmetsp:Transcript_108173/g.286651  ORF Transcript_108173/g.286651 Transcript_108173/m.286651 type:complete len:294 (+) Transcript_108173:621-1502(+)